MLKEHETVRGKPKLASNPNSRDSAIRLNPVLILETKQTRPVQDNLEANAAKGKAKCMKRKSPSQPKLLINFIIWNAKGANSSEFRRYCAEMVKMHMLAMLVLLELG